MINSEKTTFTPVRLEGTRAEDIAELRRKVHAAVDTMFDSVEYDAHGEAVNRVSVKQSKDFFSVPVMADTDIHLTAESKLEISFSSTLRQMEEELARLRVKKDVEEGVRLSKGYTASRLAEEPKP